MISPEDIKDKIDIVIPWVDCSDENWQADFKRCKNEIGEGLDKDSNTEIRYADWENLKYWFRSIEKCLPWINRVFFVTCGHLPSFLNVENPKLRIVRHDEYIPAEYLPTFNSNTIEMNLFRIPDLSEDFIIFNDDYFPLVECEENYYFKDGFVCDEAVESPIMPVGVGEITGYACRVKVNNLVLINKYFNKRVVQQSFRDKWYSREYGDLLERNERLSYWDNFCGFHDPHLPNSLKKSTLKKLWDVEHDIMDRASRNTFRSETDISWFLARYWQICEGNFIPRRALGKSLMITKDNYKQIAEELLHKKYPVVCLSENFDMEYFELIKNEINNTLDILFPDKCSFEL